MGRSYGIISSQTFRCIGEKSDRHSATYGIVRKKAVAAKKLKVWGKNAYFPGTCVSVVCDCMVSNPFSLPGIRDAVAHTRELQMEQKKKKKPCGL